MRWRAATNGLSVRRVIDRVDEMLHSRRTRSTPVNIGRVNSLRAVSTATAKHSAKKPIGNFIWTIGKLVRIATSDQCDVVLFSEQPGHISLSS